MTTADRRTDLDPASMHEHRESGHYTDRDTAASGYDTTPADDERHLGEDTHQPAGAQRLDVHDDAQRLDTQDADTRGLSDPTSTDATTTPAGSDPARTEGTYASRHQEIPEPRAHAAAGDGTPATATSGTGDKLERLVPSGRVQEYSTRWDHVKGEFVDEPRQAVAKADALVGELLDELDQLFRTQRSDLERGLDADETSTEDLRLALRRYRSFFDRLLAL